ncbi:low-density lipoprotein receptor-related protein 1B, partial [Biomphalaria glabrata]
LASLVLQLSAIATEAPTSVCQTTSCFATSGCGAVPSRTFYLRRVSLEHVRGLVREFKIKLVDVTHLVHTIRSEWVNSDWSLPVATRGLLQLYPISSHTATLTNTPLGDQHRILRELRWWITSIEAHTELLQRARLLEDSQAAHLNSRTRHLSRALTSLLRYFSVDLSSLPAEGTCIMRPSTLTNSLTKLAEFTSMALRDIHEALIHIQNVLNSCTVVAHPTGHHRVRLDCQWWSSESIFYASLPTNVSLYTFSQLTSPSSDATSLSSEEDM